jgi:putative tricarboxylic transport membrane protein
MRIGDGLFGILAGILGLAVAWQAAGFPNPSGHYFGPALFPGIIAAGLILCGALLMLRRQTAGGGFSLSAAALFGDRRATISLGLMIVSILSFVFFGDSIGFQVLTFVILTTFFIWLRGGVVFSVVLALSLAICFDLLFRELLRVPVPMGLLTAVL